MVEQRFRKTTIGVRSLVLAPLSQETPLTTTITVETHDWPVAVETADNHNFVDPFRRGYGHSRETQFVPANTKRQFHITDSRSVTFRELPKDAKSLDDDPQYAGNNACGSVIG